MPCTGAVSASAAGRVQGAARVAHLSPYDWPCSRRLSMACTRPSVKARSAARPGMSGVRQADTAVCTLDEGVASTSTSVATMARTCRARPCGAAGRPGPRSARQRGTAARRGREGRPRLVSAGRSHLGAGGLQVARQRAQEHDCALAHVVVRRLVHVLQDLALQVALKQLQHGVLALAAAVRGHQRDAWKAGQRTASEALGMAPGAARRRCEPHSGADRAGLGSSAHRRPASGHGRRLTGPPLPAPAGSPARAGRPARWCARRRPRARARRRCAR